MRGLRSFSNICRQDRITNLEVLETTDWSHDSQTETARLMVCVAGLVCVWGVSLATMSEAAGEPSKHLASHRLLVCDTSTVSVWGVQWADKFGKPRGIPTETFKLISVVVRCHKRGCTWVVLWTAKPVEPSHQRHSDLHWLLICVTTGTCRLIYVANLCYRCGLCWSCWRTIQTRTSTSRHRK